MPRKSNQKLTPENEADWYASPDGREATMREFQRAIKNGTIARLQPGESTDPTILQELLERAKAKTTKAISIRLPVADIERATEIAHRRGVGYQSVLKELIAKGLRKVR